MTTSQTYLCQTIILLFFSLAGCTSHVPHATPPWNLSPNAEASFSYLKFQDLKQRGQNEEALTAIDQTLKILPAPYLYLEKADLQWQNKKVDAARETLKEGIATFPEAHSLVLSLAKTYEAARRWEDASVTLLGYLRNHPEHWDMVRELGAMHLEQKDYARALDRLQTIPEPSRDATTWYLLGKAASGVGLHVKAIASYQKAIAQDPHFFRAKAELAYLYEVQKKYFEAMKIYEDLASQGENSPSLLLTMIRLHLKLNAPDKAFALTRQKKTDIAFQVDAAELFLDQQFYPQAAQILEPLVNGPSLPAKAWFSLALLAYDGQQAPGRAEAYLAKIPEDDPYFERALMFRANILYSLKKHQQALDLSVQGTRLFPDQPRFVLLQASLLKEMNKWQQAVDLLEGANKKWSGNIDILFSLGVLWDEHGNKSTGMDYMEQIIAIDPDYPEALNYLGYSLAVLEKNLDRAEVLVKNALKAEPNNGYYLDSLAWVFFKQGKLDKAWETIREAVTLAKKDPTIWEHYAAIATALGKKTEAAQGLANAKHFKNMRVGNE